MKIKIFPLNSDLVIRSLDRSRLKLTDTVRRNGQKNQKKEENTRYCIHWYQFVDGKVTQNENQFKIRTSSMTSEIMLPFLICYSHFLIDGLYYMQGCLVHLVDHYPIKHCHVQVFAFIHGRPED